MEFSGNADELILCHREQLWVIASRGDLECGPSHSWSGIAAINGSGLDPDLAYLVGQDEAVVVAAHL